VARLVFLGTPEVAVGPLETLVACGHEVVGVVTRPDRRRARGGPPVPSPVKAAALRGGLEVVEDVTEVLDAGAELGVVVAYGRIIPVAVLERLPMVNLHFSLLPRWRGAAPVERAILAGDSSTGVCLMALEEGLDTGPVYARAEVEIGDLESAPDLRRRLGQIGTELLLERLGAAGQVGGGAPAACQAGDARSLLLSRLGAPTPQQGDPTYAAKLSPADLELDFSATTARCVAVVRAGRAWTTFRGRRLLVHRAVPALVEATSLRVARGLGAPGGTRQPGGAREEAQSGPIPVPGAVLAGGWIATSDGAMELVEVQGAGRSVQPFSAWAAGARPVIGERLGS